MNATNCFNFLYDYSAGTLWQAREDLLKERVKCYDQNSDRFCHPALSVRRSPIIESLERIPMLVGGSKRRCGKICIHNVSPSKDSNPRTTFFGNSVAPLFMADLIAPPPEKNQKLTGNLLYSKRVVINWHKPRVSSEEKKSLLYWMSSKGF